MKQCWQDYYDKGIDYIMKKYEATTIMTRVKNKVKVIIVGYSLNSISLNCVCFFERRAA